MATIERFSREYKITRFLILVTFYLMIHTDTSAIECPKPAVQFDEDFKLEVKGELNIGVLRALKAGSGELDTQIETKVHDLFGKYPNADKLVLQNWTISMICQQLDESEQLSDHEKLEIMIDLHRKISGIFEEKLQSLQQVGARLQSDDPYERRAALADALASDDPDLQHMALSEIFASSKNFAINSIWEWVVGDPTKVSAILYVEQFNNISGDVVGDLSGSDIRPYNIRADKFRGRLSGTNFTGSNGKCTVELSLKTDKEMAGTFRCGTYGGSAIMRIR